MSDFCFVRKHKARKQHKCFLCDVTINAGEYYYNRGGSYSGYFFARNECQECHELENEYEASEHYDSNGSISDLREFWNKTKCLKCVNWDISNNECTKGMTHYVRCDNFKTMITRGDEG